MDLKEPFKKEAILDNDNFNRPVLQDDLVALAQVIQNILIYEKGTFPNQPQLGLGIRNYLFEILDNITLTTLEDEIKEQIDLFAPNDRIVDVKAEVIKNQFGEKTIGLLFFISSNKPEKDYENFLILAGVQKNTKKIITNVIFN